MTDETLDLGGKHNGQIIHEMWINESERVQSNDLQKLVYSYQLGGDHESHWAVLLERSTGAELARYNVEKCLSVSWAQGVKP